MRTAVLNAPHDLRIEERDVPDLLPTDVRVRIRAGGICGSDLHYYLHGGFGVVRLKEPMILGHEIAGVVEAVGSAVHDLPVGAKVAVNPSRPCGVCSFCRKGQLNHCSDMLFLGSAMRTPHVQGGFREVLVCDRAQAVAARDDASLTEIAFTEPLAVCLHAVGQAGSLLGKRVLVMGAGPIGVLTAMAARRAGASFIVVTDVLDEPLRLALSVAADTTLNVLSEPERLAAFGENKGSFDVIFEASGNGAALASALPLVVPQGIVVQIGQMGEATLPITSIVAKEIQLRGSFRFKEEFAVAAGFIANRLIDVRPLLTEVVPLAEAVRAFDLAADKRLSMKVQLSFD